MVCVKRQNQVRVLDNDHGMAVVAAGRSRSPRVIAPGVDSRWRSYVRYPASRVGVHSFAASIRNVGSSVLDSCPFQ